MIFRKINPRIKTGITDHAALGRQVRFGILALLAAVGLSACGKQVGGETKTERALPLAKVNDVEIAMLQPTGDAARAEGRPTSAKEAVDRKTLEMLIDRQLLQEEAMRNKLNRDPQVIQAIARATTEILAEAYLQSKFAPIAAPTRGEVDAYFQAHSELFTQRKLYYMEELVIATRDFSTQLRSRLDSAKSIETVAEWLDKNKVQYVRAKSSRSTADLAPELITKLQTMRKGQLFVIEAGEYSTLSAISAVMPSPVTAEAAVPQIERYLRNKKRKEIGDAELWRLRAAAKVEYLNKRKFASATAPAAKLAGSPTAIQIESGMTGLK